MPLTEEEKKALLAEIDERTGKTVNDVVHKAFTVRADRLEAKIAEGMDEKFAGVTKTLESFGTKLTDLVKTQSSKPGEKPSGDKGGELSEAAQAQFAEMKKMAEDAKAKADKWEKAARDRESEVLRGEEINELTGRLKDHVRGTLLGMVVQTLHGKHVVRDKANPKTMLWKKDDGDMLTLDAGVKEWIESDAGKDVRPPVEASGGGGRGPTLPIGGAGGQGGMSMEMLGQILTRTT